MIRSAAAAAATTSTRRLPGFAAASSGAARTARLLPPALGQLHVDPTRGLSGPAAAATATATAAWSVKTDPTSNTSNTSNTSKPRTPRTLPTVHSRHLPPPSCPPSLLPAATARLLNSKPGTLFAYDPSDVHLRKVDEYDMGLVRSDAVRQEVEWCLRGHAALVPGSLPSNSPSPSAEADADAENTDDGHVDDMSSVERVGIMTQLLERIEEEGRIYVELRSRVRSQVANVGNNNDNDDGPAAAAAGWESDSSSSSSDSDSSDSGTDDDDDDDDDTAATQSEEADSWRSARLTQSFGAPPGPSVAMYDTVLDCLAVTAAAEAEAEAEGASPAPPGSNALNARTILRRALLRHSQDGGTTANNAHTVPTPQTYNAILRTVASTPYDSTLSSTPANQRTRDEMLDVAFSTLDALNRSDAVSPNASTHANMLAIVAKFVPPSKSRGNIAYALFRQATSEQNVLDGSIIDAVKAANSPSNGAEFDDWVEGVVNDYGNGNLPQRWAREKKRRSMRVDDLTY